MMFENIVFPKKHPLAFSFLVVPSESDHQWLCFSMTYPLQFREWLQMWRTLSEPIFPKIPTSSNFSFSFTLPLYQPGQIPNLFNHNKEVCAIFEHYFFKSQWIRWRIRALLRFRRIQIMNRRLIGEMDVGTLELIPPHHRVCVYDWNTKAVYQFHTNTIHKNIVASLRYQSYAISLPKKPRNPYTNVEWTDAQLLVLIDQIHKNLWRTRQRHMDSTLQAFRMSQLNLQIFRKRVRHQLDIECARSFFRECHGSEWLSVYSETLDDLEIFTSSEIPPLIRTKLLDRTFPPLILKDWDELYGNDIYKDSKGYYVILWNPQQQTEYKKYLPSKRTRKAQAKRICTRKNKRAKMKCHWVPIHD